VNYAHSVSPFLVQYGRKGLIAVVECVRGTHVGRHVCLCMIIARHILIRYHSMYHQCLDHTVNFLLQAKAERKEARKLAKSKAASTITTTVTNADGTVTTTITTAASATAGAGAAAADADALDSGSDNDSKDGHNSASDTDSDSDNDSDDSDADNKEFIEKDTDQRDFQVHMNKRSICIYSCNTIILCKHH
jgi:hypothetical protein